MKTKMAQMAELLSKHAREGALRWIGGCYACVGAQEAICRVAADRGCNEQLRAAQVHTLVQLVVEHCDVEPLGVRSIIQACTLPKCSAIWRGCAEESSMGLLY